MNAGRPPVSATALPLDPWSEITANAALAFQQGGRERAHRMKLQTPHVCESARSAADYSFGSGESPSKAFSSWAALRTVRIEM
jgi:hypothetical protein